MAGALAAVEAGVSAARAKGEAKTGNKANAVAASRILFMVFPQKNSAVLFLLLFAAGRVQLFARRCAMRIASDKIAITALFLKSACKAKPRVIAMKFRVLFLGLAVVPFLMTASMAGPAPKIGIAAIADLPIVDRTPYDETANAAAAVDAAFARARKSGKRVMIDMGGNWCGDCIVLANLMRLPGLKGFLAAHFEIVSVDVGRMNKNLDIPARFGMVDRLKSGGVPAIVVAEADGAFVNKNDISALEDARHMTPQGIADWLAQWAK